MNLERLAEWAEVGRISGDEVSVKCPFHDDSNPSMSVNVATWLYYCFTCGAKGSLADENDKAEPTYKLINSMLLEIDRQREADKVGLDMPSEVKGLEQGSVYLDYLLDRGISVPTITDFSIGYCGSGDYADRLIFPINQWGFTSRTIHPDGAFDMMGIKSKYKHPKGFEISNYTYDLGWLDQPPLILVEGVFDVLRLYEFGYKAVGVFGCSLHEKQFNDIIQHSHFSEAIVALDGDKPGREATEKMCDKLCPYFEEVSFINLYQDEDPGSVDENRWHQLYNWREIYKRKPKYIDQAGLWRE